MYGGESVNLTAHVMETSVTSDRHDDILHSCLPSMRTAYKLQICALWRTELEILIRTAGTDTTTFSCSLVSTIYANCSRTTTHEVIHLGLQNQETNTCNK